MGSSVDKVLYIKYNAVKLISEMWFNNVTIESLLLNPVHRGCFDTILRDWLWQSPDMDIVINFILYEIECANNMDLEMKNNTIKPL